MAIALPGSALAAPESRPVFAAPSLVLPVACDMTIMCSIQKYVDRAPGPERLDYRCGSMTTDGHDGIDIRIRRMPDMLRNIPVVAAADGIVLRTREGMADVNVRIAGGKDMGARLAGNAVVIDHGGGWVTQYSHLRRGSVAVAPGDRIAAGARIGAIGMSGNAEFPHLHFEVRHDGKAVDPFSAALATGCAAGGASLWRAEAQAALAYQEAVVLDAGFAATAETALSMRHEIAPLAGLSDPPFLILWGAASGARDGDEQLFTISLPDGGPIFERRTRVAKGGLDWVGYAGMARPEGGWKNSRHMGHYALIRNGKIVGFFDAVIKLK